MKTSRRELLRVGLSGATVLSLGSTVPMFVSQLAFADTVAGTPISNENILVVVQLSGGNDGLNTVIPAHNDVYQKARPGLGIKDRLIKLNDELSLNPGLTAFKEMYDAGMLAIVNGCGYPEPNRSHFASMEIWHTADPRGTGDHGGWLGHYLDHCCRGTSTAGSTNIPAINIGAEIPQALANDSAPVPSIQSIDDFRVRTDPAAPNDAKRQQQIIDELNRVKDASPALQFLSRQATNAIIDANQLHKLTAGYHPDVDYPQGLGQQLKTIAQIISGNFGTKLYYCQIGGFDTHSNQVNQHENLLRSVSTSIQAFYRDLAAKKLDGKVTLMCFSEFGRRVTQNDSAGTDHGTAGPMFVVGPKVTGGLHGEYPSLTNLDSGDMKFTTDFRRVYATLLSQWLNADATAVLKDHFEPLAFLGGSSTLSRSLPQKSSAGSNPGNDNSGDQPMQSQQTMQMKAQS